MNIPQLKGKIAEFSRNLTALKRTEILNEFRMGKIILLICSDVMARGMDLQIVDNVISYDVPNYIKTYVHRVGRTARAGKQGQTYTLVRSEEVRRFKRMLAKAETHNITKLEIHKQDLSPFVASYKDSLRNLKEAVSVHKI